MADQQQAFTTDVGILHKSWPQTSFLFSHGTAFWSDSDKLVAQVLSLSRTYDRNPEWNLSGNVLRDFAELLQKCGWHVCENGGFQLAEDLFASSLRICEEHAGQMPELYADALFCSGSIASDTNRFQLHMEFARRHFAQRMKVEEEKPALGLGAGMAHSEMALAYLLNSDNARISIGQLLAILHHAQALIGLERHDEAEEMLVATLQWREMKFGVDDTESFKTGYAMQVLGTVRQKQGRYSEAMDLFQKAMQNYKKTIGLSHHRLGHVLVKIADETRRLGNLTEALNLLDQALNVFESYAAAYIPETARTTFKKYLLEDELDMNRESARSSCIRADKLYWKCVSKYNGFETSLTILTLEDFDKIVAIWAR
ncbi:hypothetical protein NPX13_g9297 [Xylaria arbuscula]|uniref:MalT-like TPR region domain-containing protein n=1 Tax=Xylaria arbuscula TaxID=114810 RepID=A0A9W8N6M8_9PEZI|nr:hypothetical protein NPX13_g9297 [Xylaria arbuscula]